MNEEIITNEELIQLVEEIAIEATNEYNVIYGEDNQLDDDTRDYLLAFVVISLFGYSALKARTDISKDIKNNLLRRFPKDYQGIKETNKKQLVELTQRLGREPLAQELLDFRKKRLKEITEGAYFSVSNEIQAIYSEQGGRSIVGAISVGDERVRFTHRHNDGKYWRASSYQPWNDYNCRCTYIYFRNTNEARQAGFTNL